MSYLDDKTFLESSKPLISTPLEREMFERMNVLLETIDEQKRVIGQLGLVISEQQVKYFNLIETAKVLLEEKK